MERNRKKLETYMAILGKEILKILQLFPNKPYNLYRITQDVNNHELIEFIKKLEIGKW